MCRVNPRFPAVTQAVRSWFRLGQSTVISIGHCTRSRREVRLSEGTPTRGAKRPSGICRRTRCAWSACGAASTSRLRWWITLSPIVVIGHCSGIATTGRRCASGAMTGRPAGRIAECNIDSDPAYRAEAGAGANLWRAAAPDRRPPLAYKKSVSNGGLPP